MINCLLINFTKVLIPTLVLAGIAALFAILLAWLGRILSVERDSKIDEVRAFLPGSNCGGCGTAGCDDFAEKLVLGDVKVSQCAQVTSENAKKIGEILGTNDGGAEPTMAVVHCNGGNKCKDKYTYLGYGNCKTNELLSGGSKACQWGCLGFASCSKVCNYDAIDVNKDGVSQVDKDKCSSCGLCIQECPKGIIERIPKSAKVYIACSNHDKGKLAMEVCENSCISCGLCAKNCPKEAITMVDNLPIIDYTKCIGCGICVQKCPRDVIKKIV